MFTVSVSTFTADWWCKGDLPSFIYKDDQFNIILQEIHSNMTSFPESDYQDVLFNKTDILQKHGNSTDYSWLNDISSSFQISHDSKYILFGASPIKRWRHSYFANFRIWNVDTEDSEKLNPTSEDSTQISPVWSPVSNVVVSSYVIFFSVLFPLPPLK